MTDAAVESIAQNGKLRELHARSCVSLTDRGEDFLNVLEVQ